MEILFLAGFIVFAVAVYFLPAVIAFWRGHAYRWPIFVLNIFALFGVLWIVLLVWSVWPEDSFLN